MKEITRYTCTLFIYITSQFLIHFVNCFENNTVFSSFNNLTIVKFAKGD